MTTAADIRASHLRLASSGVLDVRDILTRAYEPAALPTGLAVALAELLREIEKAQIVTAALEAKIGDGGDATP